MKTNALALAAIMKLDANAMYEPHECSIIIEQAQQVFPLVKTWPRGHDACFYIRLVHNFFKDEGVCLFDIATTMFGTASVCSYTGKGALSPKDMLRRLLVHDLGEYFATNAGRKALLSLIDSVKYAKRLDDSNWLAYRRTKYCFEKIKWMALHSWAVEGGRLGFADADLSEFTS